MAVQVCQAHGRQAASINKGRVLVRVSFARQAQRFTDPIGH